MIYRIHILYASVMIICIICKIMINPPKNVYGNTIQNPYSHTPIHIMILLLLMAKNYGINHWIIP